MLERVQRPAAGRAPAKWQKFPPEQRAHEAQHCVHHKSRSVVLIPSNLINPRGSALICQEFLWCRKPPPVRGGREGKKKKKEKKKKNPPSCVWAVEEEVICFHLERCRGASDRPDLSERWCVIPGDFFIFFIFSIGSLQGKSSSQFNVIPSQPIVLRPFGCSLHTEWQISHVDSAPSSL